MFHITKELRCSGQGGIPNSRQRPTLAGTPLELLIWMLLLFGVALNGNPWLEGATPVVLEF